MPGDPGNGWTLLLLHATGGDEHQLLGLGRQVAPGAALLSPRGKELENGLTRRFFKRLSPLELDIPDLLSRTDELADFVRAAASAYRLDPGLVVALGYSNGANIAASLLLRQPDVLRAASLLRPMLPYEPDRPVDLSGRAVLVAAGARDPYVPVEQTQRLAQVLGAAGADVALRVRDVGHELVQADFTDTAAWLAALMQGG